MVAASYLAIMQRHREYRRRLPHFQPDNKIFFITFCTDRRWILPEKARDIVLETCIKGNEKLFQLYGVVVMHDHVHILLAPLSDSLGPVSIPKIMQVIKGTSSHRINKLLSRRGRVWQEESFDYALRKEEGAAQKLDYIIHNPVRANLVSRPEEYRWTWFNTPVGRARTPVAPSAG